MTPAAGLRGEETMLASIRDLSAWGFAVRGRSQHLVGASELRSHYSRVLAPHQFCAIGTRLCGKGAGRAESWHQSIDLDGVVLHYLDYHCDADEVVVTLDEASGGIMVKFPLTGQTGIFQNGREYGFGPGEFAVLSAGTRFRCTMRGSSRHLTLTLSQDWVDTYLSRQHVPLAAQSLAFAPAAYRIEDDGLMLTGVLTTLVQSLARGRDALATPGVSTHVRELITSVVLGLSASCRAGALGASPDVGVPSYVLQAERYIARHLDDAICIDDLVRNTGVPRRTLYAGFRKHRGMSPMALLKTRRLHAVMSALKQPRRDDQTVTRLAMTYGFYHLGRFSKDFKDMFGVLPSQVQRGMH